jgi:tripartite-type tricarboxylate transporter receptor subunit TctC
MPSRTTLSTARNRRGEQMTPALFSRRRFVAAAAAVPLLATPMGTTLAQAWPNRPIRIVVPWPPGGLPDTGGRVVGDALTKTLGQSAVVENLPGAAGNLGAAEVAKAAPDGHTLLMGTSSIAIDIAGGRKLPFDPQRDLVPVALVADTNSAVIVPPDSPVKSIADLIAAARAKPGDLSYGTPGIGSPAHLFSELFAQMAGVKMLHVPYNRTRAINDLIGGRLSVMFATIPSSLPQIRSGQVRAIAVTGATRFPALAEFPTVAEAGLPGYEAGQWLGVLAPGGTPQPIVQRLNDEVTRTIRDPATVKFLQERGLTPLTGTPAEFARVFAADVRKWGGVIRASDIRLE